MRAVWLPSCTEVDAAGIKPGQQSRIKERKYFVTLTKEQADELLERAKPLIKWLNDNCHPHCQIEITPSGVSLTEAIACRRTEEFLKD